MMKIKDLGAVLVTILLIVSVVGAGSAEMSIETDVSIECDGIINRELSIQTTDEYSGIKFDDDLWTPALGIHGLSEASLGESISLVVSNRSVLDVNGGFEGENMMSYSCMRNYGIGTRQGNQYSGNTIIDYQWHASDLMSEMVFAGDFSGKQRSTILVRNITNCHYKIYDEDLSTKGNATIDLASSIIQVVGAYDDDDWLGCP